MTDRPILFSASMIRALLAGTKTQTRRIIKKPAADNALAVFGPQFLLLPGNADMIGFAPGDRLWVRESWNAFAFSQDGDEAWPTKKIPSAAEYWEIKEEAVRSDVQVVYRESDRAREWFKDQPWRSPIHMPRWASRLTLTVTEVRVQRLQEISEADARAEGVEELATKPGHFRAYGEPGNCWWPTARQSYRDLWDSLHGPGSWDANPWVVAVSFDVRKGNIDG